MSRISQGLTIQHDTVLDIEEEIIGITEISYPQREVKNTPTSYDETERVLLIDGDSILYMANYGTEHDIKECKFKVQNKIQEITNNVEEWYNIKSTVIVVGGRNNFRYKLHPEYKNNRPPKHPNIDILKSFMLDECNAISADYGEADDYIYHIFKMAEGNVVTAAIDKDIKANIDGHFYNYRSWGDTLGKFEFVTPEDSLYNFAVQMLIGDAGDGINFTKGIGLKYAEKNIKPGMSIYQYLKQIMITFLKVYNNDSNDAKKYIRLSYKLLKLHTIEEIKNIKL